MRRPGSYSLCEEISECEFKKRAMNSTMAGWSHPTTLTTSASIMLFISSRNASKTVQFSNNHSPFLTSVRRNLIDNMIIRRRRTVVCCSNSAVMSQSETEDEEQEDNDDDIENGLKSPGIMPNAPPARRRRRRYRKLYPGEKKGITEELRFVAMKLHNRGKPKKSKKGGKSSDGGEEAENESLQENDEPAREQEGEVDSGGGNGNGESWQPSMEGFLKYLVDSKLVFSTIERIVDESSDVSYAYFRNTRLERLECLSKDLEWLSQEGNVIPEPSNPGVVYAKYLEELGEKSPCLFLCHLYNIYFAHITGGQVIAKKVSEKLLEGRELQVYTWEGEEKELLRSVREKLNAVGEHWSRDDKNKCLREATKAFRYLGQIVRLIIL